MLVLSRQRDETIKRHLYERSGVLEYWFVDPEVDVIRIYRRSRDRFDRGLKPEATMMGVAPHPRDPQQVYGVSKAGQVFGTQDGGESWAEKRLPAGTGDCYAVACG